MWGLRRARAVMEVASNLCKSSSMNPWLWWLNDYEGRNINDGVGAQSNDNNNGDGEDVEDDDCEDGNDDYGDGDVHPLPPFLHWLHLNQIHHCTETFNTSRKR